MQGDASISFVGELAYDPRQLVQPDAKSVTKFQVRTRPRYLDRTDGQWKDGESTTWHVTAFGLLAENVAESCQRGTRVVVQGTVSRRTYEQAGVQKEVMEVIADEVAISLRWKPARTVLMDRQPPPVDADHWTTR